jgi:hypothetical protein
MQSCTECGTPIGPTIGPPVLNNGKVVCQPCWQKLGVEAAPAAASAQSAARASASGRRSVSSAPASARRQTSTTPAARRSTSTRDEPPPSRSGRAASRRDEEPERSESHGDHHVTSRSQTVIEESQSAMSSDKMKLYVIIAMCVLVIVTGVVGWIWNSTTKDRERKEREAQVAADAAIAEVNQIIKQEPENYDKQLEVIRSAEDKVKPFGALRSQLNTFLQDVSMRKETALTKQAAGEVLAQLKKDVLDPTKLESVRILLDSAMKKYSSQGKEYIAELNAIAAQLTLATLKKGIDEAKAKETQGNAWDALNAYDDAVKVFSIELKKYTNGAPAPVVALYKELLAESDRLVERTETPEYEASQPERDMLSAKERALWGASKDSIKYGFSGRELKIEGTKDKVTGICSLEAPRGTQWHDLVVDLEFTILAEGFQLFLRWESGQKGYMLQFKPSEGYDLNKPYRMTLRVKGSTISLKASDTPENRGTADATTSRVGGVAFGLNKGASIVISTFKMKLLRPKS